MPVLITYINLAITIFSLGAAMALGKPIYLGLLVGFFLFFVSGLRAGFKPKVLFHASFQSILKVKKVLLMLVLIGLIIPLWMQTGVLSTLMAYSIDAFSRFNLALAAFFSSVVVSMILGSGIGTTSTIGLVFIAISRSVGLNEALIVGAVVSGAYFGDRTSPMSSNFNLVSDLTGTDLRKNLVYMLPTTMTAFVLSAIFYFMAGTESSAAQLEALYALRTLLNDNFNISMLQLAPPAIMLFFVLGLRQNMVVSLTAALLISIGSGIMAGGFEWMPLLTGMESSGPIGALLSGGGLLSMMNALLIIMISSALSGIFEITHCLEPLLDRVSRDISTIGRLIFSTALVSLFISLVSGNQTMTSLITGGYFKKKYDVKGVDRRLLARAISDTGIVSVPLIPWNINGILVAIVTGVPTLSYMPYAINSWILPMITLAIAYRTWSHQFKSV